MDMSWQALAVGAALALALVAFAHVLLVLVATTL